MKKYWLTSPINLFFLLFLFSGVTAARSNYNPQTRELFIPVLSANNTIFEIKLTFDGQIFQLADVRPSTRSSDKPASFNAATGVATIPYIEVIGSTVVYAATLKLVASSPTATLKLASLQEIEQDLTPSSNATPIAENISIRSDPSTPFLELQLLGLDTDNDTLVYVLDAPVDGSGYKQAFVDSSDGRLFVTLRNDGTSKITLPYKVSDGKTFSRAATATITLAAIDNGGLGSDTIPPEEYGRLALTFFDGGRLGAAPDAGPTLPKSIDLSGNFPSPGNQGRIGSCVGWATAYALKSFHEKVEEQWGFSRSTIFSPAWVYNQINGGQDQGSRIDHALQLIVDKGAATWQAMPYRDSDFLTQPSQAALTDAATYKAASYRRINGIQQFKAALANKQPIVIGIEVYDSFSRLSGSDSVYNTLSGEHQGGHAITVVGYDDNRFGGAFKVINSWGVSWGDKGFFWLPYTMVSKVVVQSYVLTDAPNNRESKPIVPVAPIRDNLPNLQIVDWSVSHAPKPGGSGEWQWEVVNVGSAVAPKGYDINLMLSTDNKLDSSDWHVVYEQIEEDLPVGNSFFRDSTNSRRFTFPKTLPAGTYYMATWVDDLQQVEESNEQDNQSFGTDKINILPPRLSDLAIDYWWVSWDSFSGNGILEYTIINNGTVPTSRTDWNINLMLSNTDNPATGTRYSLFAEKGSFILNPGVTVFRDSTNQGTFNLFRSPQGKSVQNGTYFMSLWVDNLNVEKESNIINNLSVGNQLISISPTRKTRSLALNGAGSAVTTVFNGKKLPKANILMRKVKISSRADGSRSLTFINKKPKQQLSSIASTEDSVFDKVMKSADHVVFPRSIRHKMPTQ